MRGHVVTLDGQRALDLDSGESLANLARMTATLHAARDRQELAGRFEYLGERCVDAAMTLLVLADDADTYRPVLGSLKRPAATDALMRELGIGRLSENAGAIDVLRHVGAGNAARWLQLSEVFGDQNASGGDRSCVVIPLAWEGESFGVGVFVVEPTRRAEQLIAILAEHAGIAAQQLRAREAARRLHGIDPLLWVPDGDFVREALTRELSRARRYGGPVGVALVRLRCAADLRARYGNFYTDHLLRKVGGQIASAIRDTDVLGAVDGDFVVIQPGTARDGAWVAADRLSESIGVMLSSHHPELELSIIAEIAVVAAASPDDGATADALLRHASALAGAGEATEDLAA